MGAKLSKKKKGYCLGAGKDGESTETTEVEQKETETQAGQKDAAEPNGESPPNDQTLNNGASEEQKAHAEKNSTEVPSDETTKDDSKKDQKSENKPSAEQKQVEESNQQQEKLEHAKSSNVSPETAMEGAKEVKSQPKEKEQTVHDKEKELVGKDEPNQAPKPVTEQDRSEPKQPDQSVTEPSAPVPDQKEVAKSLPDSETKVEVEKMEKEQTPVPITEHLSEQATKAPTPVTESVKEPEKQEMVEPLVLETASVGPVLQEPVSVPVVELVKPEPANKAEPETTEVSLPETQPATELVKPESDLAPEPVTPSVTMTESVESKVSEVFTAPVPDIKIVEPVANPELVPCPEPEKLNETKEDTQSVPEPLPSNEVPDLTAQVEENVKNSKILENDDLGKKLLETQAATTESAPAEQPSAEMIPDQDATVTENGPTEQAVEEMQENKAQDTICTEQDVKDKEMQNDEKEKEKISDKQPTEHGCLEKGEDSKATEEVALDTSKNETDQAASEDPAVHEATQDKNPAVHEATQDKNPEDKAEKHEMPADEISREPSALLIVDKHGVGNGLPLKEELKEHLENGCDNGLHELNGQGGSHEIEVCNE